MILLPIVDRELRVAARQRSTYLLRTSFALIAVVIGFFAYLSHYRASARQFGDDYFGILASISMFYCLAAGVFLTADSLSEEKRDGTLGLLFLTDLKGYDVVLGKVAATSLRGLYALLAVVPLLALPMMIGGISSGQFWRVALVLVNSFVFSLAAGTFVSSLSSSARKAMSATFAIICFFNVVLPTAAGLIISLMPAQRHLGYALFGASPFSSLYWSTDSRYLAMSRFFWLPELVIFCLAGVFLIAAILIAPKSWQDRPAGPGAARWNRLRDLLLFGHPTHRRSFRTRLLDVNPFYWLAERAWFKPAKIWGRLAVLAILWAWGWSAWKREWFNEGIYFPTAILLNSILKFAVASEAGRQLSDDRKAGTLELILSTPLTVEAILRGQWLALRRQFLNPVIVLIGIQVIFLAASLQRESFHDNPMNPIVWLAGILMLIFDVTALGWVGMWVGLTAQKPNRVTAVTIARVLLAPWLMFIGVNIIIISVSEYYRLTIERPTWKFFVGLWFGLGIATDLAFGLTARHALRTQFRQLSLQQYSPAPSRLKQWLARILDFLGPRLPGLRPFLPKRPREDGSFGA